MKTNQEFRAALESIWESDHWNTWSTNV